MKNSTPKLIAIAAALCCAVFRGLESSEVPSPGVALRVNQNLFDYAANVGPQLVKEQVNRQPLLVPDHNGSLPMSVCEINYYLTNIKVKKLTGAKVTAKIIPDVGIDLCIENAEAFATGKFLFTYTMMWIPSTNGGSFDITLSGIRVLVKLTAGMDSTGSPIVDVTDCSATIERSKLNLNAYSSNWILGMFTGSIESAVKPTLEKEICESVKKNRAKITQLVAQNTKLPITKSKTLYMDLGLISAPKFGEGFIETKHRGEVTWANDTRRVKYLPSRFLSIPESQKMISFYASKYTINTYLYAIFNNKGLSYRFTRKDLLQKNKGCLDTDSKNSPVCISTMIPGLSEAHPGATVELVLTATGVPILDISKGDSIATHETKITMDVRGANGKLTTIGEFLTKGTLTGAPYVKGGTLHLNVTSIRLKKASLDDKVEPSPELKKLKDPLDTLQKIIDQLVLPRLVQLGKQGWTVPIPVKGLMLSEPSLEIHEKSGYLISTDIIYL